MYYKNIPVIVGAAQITQKKDVDAPLDPLNLIAKTSQKALNKSKLENLRQIIDTIYMSTISSWIYEDPPNKLSKLLGIEPHKKFIAPISGNSPQLLVNKAVKAIFKGESKIVLIAGGEASYSRYRAKKGRITLDWPKPPPKAINKARKAIIYYLSQFESRYKLTNPTYIYALIETALRAHYSRSLEAHLKYIGKLYERFSKIASENPYAWEREQYTSEEIIIPSTENRKVCHPYTKHMIANLYVDQAASLIITSEKIANRLGIDRKYWVYQMGGVDLSNIFYLSQRPKLYDSPAIRVGSQLVLDQAGLKLEDIDAFDLYSCFPCMVEISRREIGIPEDDPRDLTITGGLSFFGGPFSSYSMHSIVSAVNLIQKNPLMKIMVLANGGYNTVQSFGVYGKEPSTKNWYEYDYEEIQESIYAETLPEPAQVANGNLTVEAYTIIYDRNGLSEFGIVIGRLDDGKRTFAFILADPKTFSKLEKQELVGKTFSIEYDPESKQNRIVIKNDNFI
jgi:acetyl-CoA C-acetyltransferase